MKADQGPFPYGIYRSYPSTAKVHPRDIELECAVKLELCAKQWKSRHMLELYFCEPNRVS